MSSAGALFLKGSASNGLRLLVRVAEQLLLVPILLSAWSVPLFGEWVVLATVPTYLALSDLGFIQSGSNELARRVGEGQEADARRFYAHFTATVLWGSVTVMGLLALIVWLAPVTRLFAFSTISPDEARASFLLLMAGAVVAQNTLGLFAGLRSLRLFHVGMLLRSVTSLMQLAGAAISIHLFHAGPVGLALSMLVVQFLGYLSYLVLLWRHGLRPRFWLPGLAGKEPMLPYLLIGLEFMLFPLAQALELQGAVLMVSLSAGPVAVAAFAAHRTMARMTTQFAQIGVAPLNAEAGLLQGEAKREQMRRLVLSVSRVTFWLSLIVAAGLYGLAPFAFDLWTQGQIDFHPTLFALLLAVSLYDGIWRTVASVRLSSNRQRPLAWGYMILVSLGLGAMYALGTRLGPAGPALPLIAINLAMMILSILMTAPLLGLSIGGYLRNLIIFPREELAGLWRIMKSWRKR